jgi:hypothetical protein
MPSYGAAGNPVDVTAQGSNTGPAMMTAMEHLAESDEIDMLLLVSSLASTTSGVAGCRAHPRGGGEMRQADDGMDLHAAIGVRPQCVLGLRAVPAQRSARLRHGVRQTGGLRRGDGAAVARGRSIRSRLDWNPGCRAWCRNSRRNRRWPRGCRRRPNAWWCPPKPPPTRPPRLGFPVVLKVQSADLPHKTEAGGVRLNLGMTRAAVSHACTEMLADVVRHKPDAKIDGVLVQKMAPKGHELVIGMVNDPTFGPIMMVGYRRHHRGTVRRRRARARSGG